MPNRTACWAGVTVCVCGSHFSPRTVPGRISRRAVQLRKNRNDMGDSSFARAVPRRRAGRGGGWGGGMGANFGRGWAKAGGGVQGLPQSNILTAEDAEARRGRRLNARPLRSSASSAVISEMILSTRYRVYTARRPVATACRRTPCAFFRRPVDVVVQVFRQVCRQPVPLLFGNVCEDGGQPFFDRRRSSGQTPFSRPRPRPALACPRAASPILPTGSRRFPRGLDKPPFLSLLKGWTCLAPFYRAGDVPHSLAHHAGGRPQPEGIPRNPPQPRLTTHRNPSNSKGFGFSHSTIAVLSHGQGPRQQAKIGGKTGRNGRRARRGRRFGRKDRGTRSAAFGIGPGAGRAGRGTCQAGPGGRDDSLCRRFGRAALG